MFAKKPPKTEETSTASPDSVPAAEAAPAAAEPAPAVALPATPPPPTVAAEQATLEAAKAHHAELAQVAANREASICALEHEQAELQVRVTELAQRDELDIEALLEMENGKRKVASLGRRVTDVRATLDASRNDLASAAGAVVAAQRQVHRAEERDADAALSALIEPLTAQLLPVAEALLAASKAADAGLVLAEDLRRSPSVRWMLALRSWDATGREKSLLTVIGEALDEERVLAATNARVEARSADLAAEAQRKAEAEQKAREFNRDRARMGLPAADAFHGVPVASSIDTGPVTTNYIPKDF